MKLLMVGRLLEPFIVVSRDRLAYWSIQLSNNILVLEALISRSCTIVQSWVSCCLSVCEVNKGACPTMSGMETVYTMIEGSLIYTVNPLEELTWCRSCLR